MTPTLKITAENAKAAADAWGFNCGPGALCAVLGLAPDQLRPLLGDFEEKRYMNPTMIWDALRNRGAKAVQSYRADIPAPLPAVSHGLIRIQWGGPWTKPRVPFAARYRKTHWIAARADSQEIFDINAVSYGWLPAKMWAGQLVPWLCREVVPRWDGTWWPTHAIELSRPAGAA